MPRHDWFNDDSTMSRERDEWRSSPPRDDRRYGRESGAFFDSGRSDRFRSEDRFGDGRERMSREPRGRDFDNGRDQPTGGWGGLMGEDIERERYGDRERGRYRDDDEHSRYRNDDRNRYREERGFGSDDHNRGVPMDETEQLIASNKVEGTPVYDRFGDKLGTIHNFMVHKTKGHVVYAVLKHGGGFLGLGERYYPLEWNQLDYDTRLGGYHTRLDEEDLESFGSFDSDGRWHRRSSGRERDRGYGDDDGRRRGSMRSDW